ncbi:hypothetical protein L3Y34_006906 [Caenorhabditis briggsae]|uniref:Nuclear receptor domain-containing protein n=1 Tax=Caenorhabditis briggsae TaxID=6238 RepID=A0AAE9CYG2_CAEBR|nr:hypothetical protein L3Y34_006906 [Caenorhabditis briggsae]
MKTSPTCTVCGQSAGSCHFGAISCRACAAFFRRIVVGKKMTSVIRCDGNCRLDTRVLRKLCASCRYERCLKVGMKSSEVMARILSNRGAGLGVLGLSNETSFLEQMKRAYWTLEEARKKSFRKEENRTPSTSNYKDANSICAMDINLIHKYFTSLFRLSTSTDNDQLDLLSNQFLPAFKMLDGGFRSKDSDFCILLNGDYVDPENMGDFYSDSSEDEDNSAADTVKRILEPYWKKFNHGLKKHMKEIQLDLSEFLFASALIFWDFGMCGQSNECVEICREMRTKIIIDRIRKKFEIAQRLFVKSWRNYTGSSCG